MTDRLTVDTITSDALDALYDQVDQAQKGESALGASVNHWADLAKRHQGWGQRRWNAWKSARRRAQEQRDRAEQAEAERDGAYRERAHLAAYLAALHPSHIGYTDPNAPDWPVLIIETPAGQMSWHIAERDLDLFAHVRPTDRVCRGWDGHTTDEKYERLRKLTATAKPFRFRAFDEHGNAVCACTYGERCPNCRD